MFLLTFFRTVRRHWYLVVTGLVATACLAVAALSLVPRTYEAAASVLLIPRGAPGENPYLALSGLQPTCDAVARAMSDSEVQQQLEDSGARGEFLVETDRTTNGPILLITAKDTLPSGVLDTMQLVVAQVPRTLDSLQQDVGVPQRVRMTSTVLAQDRVANPVLKTRIRAVVAAVGVGLALTFGGVVFFDGLAKQRRRMRRPGRAGTGPPARDRRAAPSPAGAQREQAGSAADLEQAETVRLRS